jgi:CrcB protein
MLTKLIGLAGAGALGTLCRYGLAGLGQRWAGAGFPVGTLVVNVAGCFLAGLLWMLAETRLSLSAVTRTVLLVGFCGGFTTFSAFALETGQFARDAQWLRVALNLLLQNGLGLGALLLGFAVARRF